jgi:uncharacterized Fe-S center protein
MSKVYFADVRTEEGHDNLEKKIKNLCLNMGIEDIIEKGDLVAIKMHFGEKGNASYIRPQFIKVVVELVKKLGGKPFLTDTNTLYRGSRSNAVDHLNTAYEHGFTPGAVGAPVVIADGLNGKSYYEVTINQKHFKKVKIGSFVHTADAFISIAHMTGHIETGFGANLKNIGMGCGNRAAKQTMHADFEPKVNLDKCIGDGTCAKWCPADAIKIKNKKAEVNYKKCIGCGECVVSCITGAIGIKWEGSSKLVQEKIVEYAYGVIKPKKGKVGHINFLTHITPDCDCVGWTDAMIVPDIGVISSCDPVAIDQASVELVNAQLGNRNSRLKKAFKKGEDKFRDINKMDWSYQLKYAEKIGLGSRKYELVNI